MKDNFNKVIFSKGVKLLLAPIIKLFRIYEIRFFNLREKESIDALINIIPGLSKLQVLNGPFQGMKYPNAISKGSTFVPKILGSYEAELHSIISELIAFNYDEIWDIGCAEGYYAVGFAFRCNDAKIRAFDIDINSRQACEMLANINNVNGRLEICSKCDADLINDFNFMNGLIISDCEGFELDLFERVDIGNKALDYLIEIHEWPLDNNIAIKILNLFKNSHNVEIIQSVSDLYKAKHYSFYPLVSEASFSLETRYNAFRENRGGNEMLWYYFKRKV